MMAQRLLVTPTHGSAMAPGPASPDLINLQPGVAPGIISSMSGTGDPGVVSGTRDGLGTAMIRELHGCDIRTRGVNRGGEAAAPARAAVLADGTSQGSRRAGTRKTVSP